MAFHIYNSQAARLFDDIWNPGKTADHESGGGNGLVTIIAVASIDSTTAPRLLMSSIQLHAVKPDLHLSAPLLASRARSMRTAPQLSDNASPFALPSAAAQFRQFDPDFSVSRAAAIFPVQSQ